MRLGLRLFFAFFLINGIAAFFVLRVFVVEIKPSVRKVTEDTLVEAANALSALAASDLASGRLEQGVEQSQFAQQLQGYADRPIRAWIWDARKTTLDLRVTITNQQGLVLFDSDHKDVGADYSRWQDVARTLRGEYGARTTRDVQDDEASSVMYVSAPVWVDEKIAGVLTVSKPARSVQRIVDSAENKVLQGGLLFVLLSGTVGCIVTWWFVWHVRRLRNYAMQVQSPQLYESGASGGALVEPVVPQVAGELGELAHAMDRMRVRLQGREYIEDYVRALTHELKSPIAAIRASGELLQDDLPEVDRQVFTQQILEQAVRLQNIVDQLMQLSRLEQRQKIQVNEICHLKPCAQAVVQDLAATARLRNIGLQVHGDDGCTGVWERGLLQLALSNLLQNAIDFSPNDSTVIVSVEPRCIVVRDGGPGVPEAILSRLGERFFTTPRPDGKRSGTGLGLSIVRRIMQLHGGSMDIANSHPGLSVTLHFPK